MFSDRITLRNATVTADSKGYPVQSNTDTEVWASAKSVTRAEFYSANANGIQASMMFQVHVEDWGNQKQVVYNSKTYDIVRSYQKGSIVELTCSDKKV